MKRPWVLLVGLFLLVVGLSGCRKTQDATASAGVESSEKQELILAGMDFDASLLSAVETFNQASDDTVITLRDYGNHSSVLSSDVLERVYRDVVTGDIPDMYVRTHGDGSFVLANPT